MIAINMFSLHMQLAEKFAVLAFLSLLAVPSSAISIKKLFDDGWKFSLSDTTEAYQPQYDDRLWRRLSLPHDWSIESLPQRNAPSGNDGGYFRTGIGWYRKAFDLPRKLAGQKMWLYFEGVYMNATIWVNGKEVGSHAYGYTSFFCDITQAVRPGEKNVVAVRVDNSRQKNCRWYSGSGIYRHVWLIAKPKLHINNWGINIKTVKATKDIALVRIDTKITNDLDRPRTINVISHLGDAALADTAITIPAHDDQEVSQIIKLNKPALWSLDHPVVHQATITLKEKGTIVDEETQEFGIRTLAFNQNGFFLNAQRILINGACMHHDNGILGAASFDRAEYRKVMLMKEAGFNAIRTSHNPPSPAFLKACDHLGMLVIDEAFDGWREKKNDHDYHELFDSHWKDDIDAMVLRDRNHPSIISWSIGNEVIERKKIEVVTTARKLAAEVRRLDGRPVTSALASWDKDWEIYDPLAAQLDITGYNYLIGHHASDHERVPGRLMWQTESYPKDAFCNYLKVHNNPYVFGDFVWTGLDYLGESGIGRYWYEGEVPGEHYERPLFPCHASYCGDLDLIGVRKPISHYRDMLWNDHKENLYMAVREPDGYNGKIHCGLWAVWPTWESWDWPGWENKNINVVVCSHYPNVRLRINNRIVGEKAVGLDTEYKAVFDVPYEKGTLIVEGLENGIVKESRTLCSSGIPYAIRLHVENDAIEAGENDISYINVEIVDKNGILCPNASNRIHVKVKGEASLQALGNADIQNMEGYTSNSHKVWKGRALLIIRSTQKPGNARLLVSSDGLKEATANIRIQK